MNRRFMGASIVLLLVLSLLSQAGHVQGKLTVTADIPNHKINYATDNLTFYFWYGPSETQVYINPTFAWSDNKQPSILYVVDLLGLTEYREPNSTLNDYGFQRNEAVRNGTFSWVGNEVWSYNNLTTTHSGVTSNLLNLTLSSTQHTPENFTYTSGNITLGSTNYGTTGSIDKKFYGYSYTASQARTDLFFNMTRWKWNANSSLNNLALMLGFYALNTTVIQNLGIRLENYIVQDYNFIPPEDLRNRYYPLNPAAFPLTGMELSASSGATTTGGSYSLSQNETTLFPPLFEHRLNYTLATSSNMPFVKLQFANGNTTLPGYFTFPGFAVGLDNNGIKQDTLNVTASYISTGNYLRLFLGYPYFGTDMLRHFISFGVDDSYLPPAPTPAGVYIVLPSIATIQALLIGGLAVVSIIVAVFSTRAVRQAGLEMRK